MVVCGFWFWCVVIQIVIYLNQFVLFVGEYCLQSLYIECLSQYYLYVLYCFDRCFYFFYWLNLIVFLQVQMIVFLWVQTIFYFDLFGFLFQFFFFLNLVVYLFLIGGYFEWVFFDFLKICLNFYFFLIYYFVLVNVLYRIIIQVFIVFDVYFFKLFF